MFDLDAGKLLVFGIVALAVIPPKDLPRVLRTVGQYVGRMRRMANEFQGQFMDAMKEAEKAAELESVKKEFSSLHESTKIDTSFDPTMAIRADTTHVVEPPKTIGTSEIALGLAEPVPAEPIAPAPTPFSSEVIVKAPPIPDPPAPPAELHAPSAAP